MDTNELNSEWPANLKGSGRLPGIPNLGVTCFANCIMQVFNHTPALVNHFRKYSCNCEHVQRRKKEQSRKKKQHRKRTQGRKKRQGRNRKKNYESEEDQSGEDEQDCYNCVMKEYIEQFEACQKKNGPIEPKNFLNFVMKHTRKIRVNRMSDAEEFFMHISHKLEDSRNKSILDDIYSSKLKNIYCCKDCNNEWHNVTTERLLVSKGNLPDQLAELSKETKSDVRRTCDKCGEQRDCTEKTVIVRPPHVLQIKINIKSTRYGGERTDFPATINIRPYMEVNGGSAIVYELYAVVVLGGIHYYAYCKAPNEHWNICNDRTVSKVPLEEVLQCDPYSLFYKRSPELDDSWVDHDEPIKNVYKEDVSESSSSISDSEDLSELFDDVNIASSEAVKANKTLATEEIETNEFENDYCKHSSVTRFNKEELPKRKVYSPFSSDEEEIFDCKDKSVIISVDEEIPEEIRYW